MRQAPDSGVPQAENAVQITAVCLSVWGVTFFSYGPGLAHRLPAAYQLRPYAHELDPAGLVWSHLKRSLANLAKRNLSQLTALVKTGQDRLNRMQYRPGLLDGFLAKTGLDLTPFCNPTIKDCYARFVPFACKVCAEYMRSGHLHSKMMYTIPP
jgi:hypothetical protein